MISQRKIELEKTKLRKNCKCSGTGCSICYGYCSYVDKMAEANIPVDYWFRKMEDFYGDENFKKSIISYINNIDGEFDKGLVYCFTGGRGKGKTMAACAILKTALLPNNNYNVIYFTLSDIINNLVNLRANINSLSKYYDFIAIDEVDRRFFPTQASMELYGNQLENILRSRMQNKLPTIMCTNSADIGQIFDGDFKKSFDSLGSQFIKTLPAGGKDAREGKEKL